MNRMEWLVLFMTAGWFGTWLLLLWALDRLQEARNDLDEWRTAARMAASALYDACVALKLKDAIIEAHETASRIREVPEKRNVAQA